MAKELTYWEGKWSDEEPPISYFNRAFRFGDGVFETIKFFNGKSPFLDFHLERLSASCNALKMHYSNSEEECVLKALTQLSEHNDFRQAVVRIWAYREGTGKYTPTSNRVKLLLRVKTSESSAFKLNEKGLSVDLADSVVLSANQFSPLKSMNSLPYVMASIEKEEKGFDELLLQNQKGEVIEACSSNLFIVRNKVLYTPPVESGILNGVMRRVIIQIANQAKMKVVEKAISMDALQEADELFLTNAISGIQWVKAFRKKRYFHKVSTSLMQLLNQKL
ncbi:MAG: aminotransferase class IV [Vicingaceae bacterium]